MVYYIASGDASTMKLGPAPASETRGAPAYGGVPAR